MLRSVFPKATRLIWKILKFSYLSKYLRRVKYISFFGFQIKIRARVYAASQLLKTIIDFKSSMSWKSLAELRAVKTSQGAEFPKLWGRKSIEWRRKRRHAVRTFNRLCYMDLDTYELHKWIYALYILYILSWI